MSDSHPCQNCGGCCAFFRVSFPAQEVSTSLNAVPKQWTEPHPSDPARVSMRGTGNTPVRCDALQGDLGKSVVCRIYSVRPSVCRSFWPSFENGKHNPACDDARAALGLPALTLESWQNP
jgi:Fe-S-cluster containining protein